jgi:hypothetical protein
LLPVPTAVHYLPLVTTVIALAFSAALFRRYRKKGGTHLLWWGIGALTYAAGTAVEASVTLFGWSPWLFRLWYVFGALLGGAPLAQGSVYLHLPRRVADRLTAVLLLTVAVAGTCVIVAPLRLDLVQPHRLSGSVLGWSWVRAFSPFINLYAFLFLVGGAVRSALLFARRRETYRRAQANVLIAVGAILPGIGGTFTRFGHTEVLYATELIGIVLIYLGYRLAVTAGPVAAMENSAYEDLAVVRSAR